jgi:hypothetical protein
MAVVNISLRNVTNQPIVLVYKAATMQLRDNLGHSYRFPTNDPRLANQVNTPFAVTPGVSRAFALPHSAFDRGQNPPGAAFAYSLVIDQVQVLQNGQVRVLREYPLSFAGLTNSATPGPATKAAAAAATAPVAAARKPAVATVPKR